MHALVRPEDAEKTRRALDAERLLDLRSRAFRTQDGWIALPLSCAAETAHDSSGKHEALLCWCGTSLPVAELHPPEHCMGRGPRAALITACGKALAGGTPHLVAAILNPKDFPRRWEKVGDIVMFAPTGLFDESTEAGAAFKHAPSLVRSKLLKTIATALGARCLGIQSRIDQSLKRKSTARLIWPEETMDGWTQHRENGIIYGLDVTRSMFSSGNGTEKARVASFPCAGETVVDLYAGIGYFSLAYLVHAGVAHLHACEWDEDALIALRSNLKANGVADRCTVHPGDNATSLPAFRRTAHRVNLGLIPSSEAGWPTAVAALRSDGGMLHVHANVCTDDEVEWTALLVERIRNLAAMEGHDWEVRQQHVERVKWYAPKIRHVVVDVSCTLRTNT